MKREKLLSEIVQSNYTELSRDAQGLLKGGFGSVSVSQMLDDFVQNNCACNSNNCNCSNRGCQGVNNNCACAGNNCNCSIGIKPTPAYPTVIPSGLLSM